MSLPAETKRKRRWAPKVRTGCKTCKARYGSLPRFPPSAKEARRKKCDEGKPECLRCIKDGFSCDGYDPPKAWIFTPSRDDNFDFSAPTIKPTQSPPSKCENGQALLISQQSSTDLNIPENPMTQSNDDLDFLLEPSSPWTSELDHNYMHYFLDRVVPILATTSQWRYFWQATVPQAAWQNPAVHHAMIAIAATFKSNTSGIDHTDLIVRRRSLAIRAFTAQSTSWDLALIVCRLFSSMAQCQGDYNTAIIHIKSGEKILKEGTRNGQTGSEIARLMAPTFLGLLADTNDDLDIIKRFRPNERKSLLELKAICFEYGQLLRTLARSAWDENDSPTHGLLSTAFSTLNQAISSAMYPSILNLAADAPVLPASQVRTNLMAAGDLLSFDELKTASRSLFSELAVYFKMPENRSIVQSDLRWRLKMIVDNYVVILHEIEPRMTAGTFWNDDDNTAQCLIGRHLQKPQLEVTPFAPAEDFDNFKDNRARERRQYYMEHVCQYRSGFMA